jgi:hypothetical protein
MLHLYFTVLLAVIAANTLAVTLAIAIKGQKHNHWT